MDRWGGFCRGDLGELSLHEHAQLRQVIATEPLKRRELVFRAANGRLRVRDEPLGLRLCLAHGELRLTLRLFPHLGSQLLRAHQRLVESLVALAKGFQLVVKGARLLLQLLVQSRESL